jgi:metal-responsive CopG/Arc/MetJ family transcriptional regulator
MKSVITISIDKDLLKRIDEGIKDYKFANRSHGFEYLISREILKKKESKN